MLCSWDKKEKENSKTMGMSSSQARLLSLTGRMHDIELKAQRIQAQKLRLANESDAAYNDYLIALDAKKLQYRSIATDGTVTYREATMNALQNGIKPGWDGNTSQEVLFLQDTDGRMYITPWVASQYGLQTTDVQTKTLDEYLESCGHTRTKATPVYKYDWDDDETDVLGVNFITNQVQNPDVNANHSGYDQRVENKLDGKFDPSELTKFAVFNTTGITTTNSASTEISSADDLFALNGQTKTGTIILKNDITIDPTDTRWANWTGITLNNAAFNGNGHTISGLTGKQGLFSTATNSTIDNVKIEVGEAGIHGGDEVGALVGYASSTDISNCCSVGGSVSGNERVGGLIGHYYNPKADETTVNNVYSTCDVSGATQLGGLMGKYWVDWDHGEIKSNPHFDHAFATGNVSGTSNIGGLVGYYWCDPDKGNEPGDRELYTDVSFFFTGGTLSGTSNVGGLAGFINGYSDYEDIFRFYNIVICTKLPAYSAGSSIGLYIGENSNSGGGTNRFYDSNYGVGINPEYEADHKPEQEGVQPKFIGKVTSGDSDIPDDAITTYTVHGRIPSREALTSNIEAALIKAGKYDPCHPDASPNAQTNMRSQIAAFLNQFSTAEQDDMKKLWFLNENICKYLDGDTSVTNLGDLLYQDVMSPNCTNWKTAAYQTGTYSGGNIKYGEGDYWDVTFDHSTIPGTVVIPSRSNIADEIYYALMRDKVEPRPDRNLINNYINNTTFFPNTQEGLARLAYINDKINAGEYSDIYYNYIEKNSAFTDTGIYNPADYTISISEGTITPNFRKVETKTLIDTIYDWDWDDPQVKKDAAMWRFSLKGIQVVSEEQASDPEYLKNYIVNGFGVLTTFKPENANNLPENVADLDDAQYDEIMGIKNTSIAENTTVHEVENKTDVKKAEAEYEAKMRRINQKDARYDKELSVCENERQAIKTEMDTLKTVIRDNVDLNFKLFS